MTFWKSQFDKVLMALLFSGLCALAFFATGNDKLATFALQSGAGCLGCLLTLVTSRKGTMDIVPPEGGSATTQVTTTASTDPTH